MNTGFTANGENGLTQNSKILPGDALTVVREEETLEVRITKVESGRKKSPIPPKPPSPTS